MVTADHSPVRREQEEKRAQSPAGAACKEEDKHVVGTKLGNYIFDKSLGKGTFGKVKLAVHTPTKEKVGTRT